MELGVHLPLMQLGDDALSRRRLEATVDAAKECGFAAISANDHLVFGTPWLDGRRRSRASSTARAGRRWRRRSRCPRCAGPAPACVGSSEHCAELLSRYAEAGCGRVYLWPLGDEARQLELIADTVAPQLPGR